MKYECGRQKTIRSRASEMTLEYLTNQIMTFYPFAHGQVIKVVYAVPGIAPKQYKSIKSENYMDCLIKAHDKLEFYLTIRSSKNGWGIAFRKKNAPRCSVAHNGMHNAEQLYVSESSEDDDQQAQATSKWYDNTDDLYKTIEEHDAEGNVESLDVSGGLNDAAIDNEDDDMETQVGEGEINIENQEECYEEVDDIYSEDSYHSVASFEDCDFTDEVDDIADDVR